MSYKTPKSLFQCLAVTNKHCLALLEPVDSFCQSSLRSSLLCRSPPEHLWVIWKGFPQHLNPVFEYSDVMFECDCTETVLSVHTGVLCAQPVEGFGLHPWPEERHLRARHQQDAHARCKWLVFKHCTDVYWCNCADVWLLVLTFRLVHHGVRLKKWKVKLSKMSVEHRRMIASSTWWVQNTKSTKSRTQIYRTYSVRQILRDSSARNETSSFTYPLWLSFFCEISKNVLYSLFYL